MGFFIVAYMVSSWIIILFSNNNANQNKNHSPTISRLKMMISNFTNQSASHIASSRGKGDLITSFHSESFCQCSASCCVQQETYKQTALSNILSDAAPAPFQMAPLYVLQPFITPIVWKSYPYQSLVILIFCPFLEITNLEPTPKLQLFIYWFICHTFKTSQWLKSKVSKLVSAWKEKDKELLNRSLSIMDKKESNISRILQNLFSRINEGNKGIPSSSSKGINLVM